MCGSKERLVIYQTSEFEIEIHSVSIELINNSNAHLLYFFVANCLDTSLRFLTGKVDIRYENQT